MVQQVLLVDSGRPPDGALRVLLGECGVDLHTASSMSSALTWLAVHTPVCVLVRVVDGESAVTCRLGQQQDVPVIALCEEGGDEAALASLEAGAAFALHQPLSRRQMLARFEAIARRNVQPPSRAGWSDVYTVGDLTVDGGTQTVSVGEEPVSLTPTEYRLLVALARRAGAFVSASDLREEVWDAKSGGAEEGLKLCIRQLRLKLGDTPARPTRLINRRGVGYRLAGTRETHEEGRRGPWLPPHNLRTQPRRGSLRSTHATPAGGVQ